MEEWKEKRKWIEAQTSRLSLIQRLLPSTIVSFSSIVLLLSASLFRWRRISRPSQRERTEWARSSLSSRLIDLSTSSTRVTSECSLMTTAATRGWNNQDQPASSPFLHFRGSKEPVLIHLYTRNIYIRICIYMYTTHDFSVSRILPNDQRLSSTHFSSTSYLELRFVHTDEYAERARKAIVRFMAVYKYLSMCKKQIFLN